MKRRIALVSSCRPPSAGAPVTGGGLRTLQLLQTLQGAGHSVTLMIEKAALPEQAGGDLKKHAFTPATLSAQLEQLRPDVVVAEQWALLNHLGAWTGPTVVDLHGSLLLENTYRRGHADLMMDAGAKVEALCRADLMLVPAAVQLHHFASWATLAGFDPRELPIKLLPLAIPGPPVTRRHSRSPKVRMIYGGARWPWIDSSEALLTAANFADRHNGVLLDVFTYDPPRHGLIVETNLDPWGPLLKKLKQSKGAALHSNADHAAYVSHLRTTATLALDLWKPNPERMLAATTRCIEYLAAGVPVITIEGAAWAEELTTSGAGWTIPAGDDVALKQLLKQIHTKPRLLAEASAAATALVADRHSLAAAGADLLAFCDTPTRPLRQGQTLIEGLMEVRQGHLDEDLSSLRRAHESEHKALVKAHRTETDALRDAHLKDTERITRDGQRHLDEIVAEHRRETTEREGERRSEVQQRASEATAQLEQIVKDHRAQARELRRDHKAEIAQLVRQHKKEQAQSLSAHQKQQGLLEERHRKEHQAREVTQREELASAASGHEADRLRLVAEFRTQSERDREDRRTELEAATAQHKESRDALVAEQQRQTQAAVDQRKEELKLLRSEHKEQTKAQAVEAKAQSAEAAAQLKAAVVDHQAQIKALEAAHQQQLQDREAAQRAELEAAAAQHKEAGRALNAEFRSQSNDAREERRAETAAMARDHKLALKAQLREFQKELKTVVAGHKRQQKMQDREATTNLRRAIKEQEGSMTKTHNAAMSQSNASREAELQRIVGQWQAEVAQMDTQNQAEMKAQDVRHREEISRIVTEGQERVASSDGDLEALKAQLAEARDRLRGERHRHKEELTRIEIELKSSIHRAEERQRDAEERLRKAQEEASHLKQGAREPSANPQLAGRDLARLLPKRPLQTARLAKLWVEHALDRDDQ